MGRVTSPKRNRALWLSLQGSIYITADGTAYGAIWEAHWARGRLHRQLRGALTCSFSWYQTSCCSAACTTCPAAWWDGWLAPRLGFIKYWTLPPALERGGESSRSARGEDFNIIKIQDSPIRTCLFENMLKCLTKHLRVKGWAWSLPTVHPYFAEPCSSTRWWDEVPPFIQWLPWFPWQESVVRSWWGCWWSDSPDAKHTCHSLRKQTGTPAGRGRTGYIQLMPSTAASAQGWLQPEAALPITAKPCKAQSINTL